MIFQNKWYPDEIKVSAILIKDLMLKLPPPSATTYRVPFESLCLSEDRYFTERKDRIDCLWEYAERGNAEKAEIEMSKISGDLLVLFLRIQKRGATDLPKPVATLQSWQDSPNGKRMESLKVEQTNAAGSSDRQTD